MSDLTITRQLCAKRIAELKAELKATQDNESRLAEANRQFMAEQKCNRCGYFHGKDPCEDVVALEQENQRLKEKLDWLDNNTTHYLTNESEAPVLAGVAEKIWYHATDDVDSYPFSAVIDKALENQHE